ncbi:MAG: hypothetical protein IJI01_06890 [Butyrivibrio sp.]|uniref:LiaF transmembrane domain-containing protein n=1 Tax=Butyrivibrio sp. TaxID=28121 RepID=UPI0025B9DBEC|nr:DUF5668 domain-containing protein [Butyrivibrio sp.]MBQ6588384.1 hypothetical protein [Butyrivibrio sp.]
MDNTIRVHRVGSITTGLGMIAIGVAFLLHLFLGIVSYELIFRLWPLMIIGLGIELLISNFMTDKIVYDKAAIFLMIVIVFFAMGMAGADMCFEHIGDAMMF